MNGSFPDGDSERRIVESGHPPPFWLRGCPKAIKAAGITASDIDLIICATVTPDMIFPATACIVQDKIGAVSSAALI